ncbi:hypothetical protein QG516_21740 [Pedobacter gandavensis]|uniref:YybH family protein n=1 Tax=Pedobacter gandavensis TaxID=2679963 RepID=UPI00247AAC3C|nr:hypothetical protein [Pedobacter gandavensis]WGQ09138.1 hypothetical protein QG516_21740 [Pedobacter gandavensis]
MEEFNRKTQIGAVAFFRNCLKNRDVKGAMSCFDPEGVYIDRDGKEISERTQVEKAMQYLCALGPEIKGAKPHVTTIGNLSLWLDEWEMIGKTPDNQIVKMNGHTACMMKRNTEGIWLWLVDNPFGAAVLKQ